MKGREPTRKSTRNVTKVIYTQQTSNSTETKEGPKQRNEKNKKRPSYKLASFYFC